ncbi:hypothetical protein C8J57DRAFT_1335694 [Mycena rebaudengoi]|nr:hypothetical protein C8J57DRAFT_1335694 [Mycena rebaudengoi]
MSQWHRTGTVGGAGVPAPHPSFAPARRVRAHPSRFPSAASSTTEARRAEEYCQPARGGREPHPLPTRGGAYWSRWCQRRRRREQARDPQPANVLQVEAQVSTEAEDVDGGERDGSTGCHKCRTLDGGGAEVEGTRGGGKNLVCLLSGGEGRCGGRMGRGR